MQSTHQRWHGEKTCRTGNASSQGRIVRLSRFSHSNTAMSVLIQAAA